MDDFESALDIYKDGESLAGIKRGYGLEALPGALNDGEENEEEQITLTSCFQIIDRKHATNFLPMNSAASTQMTTLPSTLLLQA